MLAFIRNIAIFLLALAVGLSQPVASSLGIASFAEVDVCEEKETLDESNINSRFRLKRTVKEIYVVHNHNVSLLISDTSHPEAPFSSPNHELYLMYDTWLI